MRVRTLILFAVVLVCVFTAAAQRMIESESSAVIKENASEFSLVIFNNTKPFDSRIALDLLDTDGNIRASAVKDERIGEGRQTYKISIPLGDLMKTAGDDIAWYRLQYRVGDSSGIVSMSQMVRDLFELRIIAGENVLSGMTYRVRVRALNPFDGKPAAGVKIETAVELALLGEDSNKLQLKNTGETDADGFAVVDFTIPPETKLDDDGEIKVTGNRNGIIREAKENLNALKDDVQFLMMTDKPIYQPEQIVNIRGILFKGGESKTVLASEELEFRITDEDDTLLYREKLSSSDFGIASIGWRVPANARLGNYRIEARNAIGDQVGGRRIKVSRYDLPNFVVTAKPLKPYYLPGENQAEVEVKADYLFGKPVTKGKVRVVEETSREWNWKEQKYDIGEGQVREGETDENGKFTANFDLKEKLESLKEDDWRKFEDISFAAYFTDLTTNKTEQRRFDIRVTREAIHVYFIGNNDGLNPELPISGYISTFYADGTPAECEVQIKASVEDEDKFKTVGSVKTNSFGIGRIRLMKPKIGKPDDNLDFRIIAKDKEGRQGTFDDNFSFDDSEEAIKITTDRTIYKPGDSINAAINSTLKTGTVYVDVIKEWSVIDSRFAELKDGKAELQIPYNESFKGELKIAAFTEDDKNYEKDKVVISSRGIIFPARQNIKVEADFDKAVYKPNEEATVKLGVVDAVGQAVKSALGIVVLDKAVEERSRTDAEFGDTWRDYAGFLGFGSSFAGVNLKDINELDLTKPISDEMQLVAEVMLYYEYYSPNIFRSRSYDDEAKSIFSASLAKQFATIYNALSEAYVKKDYLHPVDDASFNKILTDAAINFDQMRDPWGIAYRPAFSVEKERDILSVISAGPDKQFGTNDDFTAFSAAFKYFTPIGRTIDTVVKNYNARTGEFIRDEKTLLAELGIRQLSDRFGRPYKFVFDSAGRYLKIKILSSGQDGKFEPNDWAGDDFYVWTNQIDYFADTEQKISDVQRALKRIPMNEAEFKKSLKQAGIDFDKLRDGYGNPLYLTVGQKSRYFDKVTLETVQNFGESTTTERRKITPVTQQIIQFTIRSNGKDGKQGTNDDITLNEIVHVLAEQTKDDLKPVTVIKPIAFKNSGGSIAGIVTDPIGAIIPGAAVTATNDATGVKKSTTTNDSGQYLITNLTAGTYSIRVTANGFKDTVLRSIPIKVNATMQADVTLNVGTTSVSVEVTSAAETMETTNASMSTVTSRQIMSLPVNGERFSQLALLRPGINAVTKSGTSTDATSTEPNSTPRIREYFPETLLWQPELITNKNGKTELKFRMADNITTWKMYAIASTKNGKVGVAEKEVTAFQSFFADLDPPKFLTDGDEIYLPTQVRNYTDKKQKVEVTMDKADWFSLLSSDKQQIDVAAGESQNAVFGFKAVSPVKDGKQRVTAIAQTDSDAIEKPVTVRPNGQEIVRTDSKYFTGIEIFKLDFPANALSKTQKAELKIYPNLYSHVAESVDGLLKRPYGCGEQTISSTYPNLMILKFAKPDSAIALKARKYLQKGYERLLGYQAADGGFTYWGGKDLPDLALTAYALRFLTDASLKIEVNADVIKRAEDWLIRQQKADGSWIKLYRWEASEDKNRTKLMTTYVTRSLAMLKETPAAADVSTQTARGLALSKSLAYLKQRNAEIDEPYAMALFGLASLDAGDRATAATIAERLESMAITEGNSVYWNLETNTPFYGWGTAGRIETTALVTQLLIKLQDKSRNEENPKTKDLIQKAMLFLLKNKDRYGVWYSTQTTINVLDAYLAALAENKPNENRTLQVFVNGENIQSITVPSDKIEPIIIDLTGKLSAENNEVRVQSSDDSPLMSQLVASHYIDWNDANVSNRNINQSRSLQLDYKCDKTNAAIMEEVNCSVSAKRMGFKGYGMLLAEIGIPPGADVSRESLEKAIENDWSISRYEILPDRIIIYMWSKAEGTNFNFKFRPRYGINAQTPASVVYDYYNPEAQATVAPLQFSVK